MGKLVVATYNLSAAACERHPDKVLSDILGAMSNADILCCQEAGKADHILRKVERAGYHVYYGDGDNSQAATPVVTKKKPRRSKSFFLSKSTHVGEAGAGPATLKEKWLNVVWLRYYGRSIRAGSMHTSPSIYIKIREWLAKRQCDRAGDAMSKMIGLKFVAGDFNSVPTDSVRDGLEHAKLISSQLVQGPKDTEGNRSIDDVYYSKSRYITLVRTWTEEGASDHRKFFAEFNIKPTLIWRLKHRK
jgi:endonuclease/exonuclease/phosphatase family metal-dependent hydrolase